VTVKKRTNVARFARKVEKRTGLSVKAFDLKYDRTTLQQTKGGKQVHVRDYGLVDGCIVDVVIHAKPRTRTVVPKDQKFSLDFRFEVGLYLLFKMFDF
jgi:hypothetical protein